MGVHRGVKSESCSEIDSGEVPIFGIDNLDIYDVGPFLLLPAMLDLRPLVRELLVSGSSPLLLARLAAQISP